eukprot:gene10375-10533_t
MFSGELKAAANKLQREQAERAEQRHQQELEQNRGVALRLSLAAAPASAESVAARGIKRAADKLVLPPSAGTSLMAQDASKNGAMLFEVAAGNGGRTHAGNVHLPVSQKLAGLAQKLAYGAVSLQSLPVPDLCGPENCNHVVRYKLLPKGTYVRFQPELRAFHEVVGADPEVLRTVLESCLLGYCTLSEGDWVQVTHDGVDYNLRVLELQPGPAVSVIETDIAADVGPSIETEGYLRAQQELEAREAERLRQEQEAAEKAAAEALVAEEAAAAAEQQHQAEEAARRLQIQAEKEALLLPELPADSQQPHVSLMFRLPDGARMSRRFGLQQRVQELYDFVDSKGAGGLWPNTYQLVLQYPRLLLSPNNGTLQEAGMLPGQQAVFLERLEG